MDVDPSPTIPPPHGSYVGIDVVDLTTDRIRTRELGPRFLQRVFTEAERSRIESAPDPTAETWTLWAAKEAGFKVISKVLGSPPVFEHRSFEVTDPPGQAVRALRYRDFRLDLTVWTELDHIVVHAWNDPSAVVLVSRISLDAAREVLDFAEPFDVWCERMLSADERNSVHSHASAFVRLLARRDAARFLDLEEARLSIRCPPGEPGRRPPFLYLDGEELSSADVSFSHHGSQLAWALSTPWAATAR
jgi:phosphopantetheine--protein transferase-like protein